MNIQTRFDRDSAARIAQAIRNSDDPVTDLTARGWVNEWFADYYGWPLRTGERAERDAFLEFVIADLRE